MTRKMKETGIEWIGEIPEDWDVIRIKNLILKVLGGKWGDISKKDENDTKVVRITDFDRNSCVVKKNKLTIRNIKNINEELIINRETDLLIEKSGGGEKTPVGQVVKYTRKDNAIFTNFISKLTLKIDITNLNYVNYLFSVLYDRKIVEKHIKQTTGIQNLDINSYLNERIALPFLKEQEKIANFLDQQTEEIDNIISNTEKSIEELKAYKQALISQTVTKGLETNVSMKDSGIEWIGEIPEHWDTIKFKDLFKFGSGLTITKSDLLDEGIKVINYGEIHSKYKFDLDINRDELKCVDKSYLENRKNALINKGDFVFCDTSEDREGSGNCIVLRENNDELIFAGSHTVTARLTRNENPIYIRYMIMASSVKEQISSTVVGIKVYSITQAILKTIIGVLPPLKDQEQIASYLDKKCSQIDNIISTKEKLLIEMEAYKKSLIYEYVTGKKEVI